jgi:hypothetical protein
VSIPSDRPITCSERGTRASPEAEDIALEHPTPPFAVEGRCSDTGDMCALPREASGAYGVSELRNIREASRSFSLNIVSLSTTGQVE